MKKVLILSIVVLSMFVSCKKNDAVENPAQQSPALSEEPVQESVELSEEQKKEQKIEQILNDGSLTVYQKLEAIGYQSDDKLKINYQKNSGDKSSWCEREIKYDMGDKKVSKEKLMSTVWVLDKDVAESFVLIFYSDDFFAIGDKTSGPSAFGKYDTDGGVLTLKSFSYDPSIAFYDKIFSKDEVICRLNFTSTDYSHGNELFLLGVKFLPEGSEEEKENGVYAVLEGHSVDVIKSTKVMSENVKFHTEPSADSKTQDVEMYAEMFPENTEAKTDVLRRGTVVKTYGLMHASEMIDGVQGRWYYVSVPKKDGEQYGWIFGAYFVDYDAARQVEYKEILNAEFNSSPKEDFAPFANNRKLDLSDSSKYEVHDVNLFMFFSYDGFNTKVYDSPELEKEIYTLQKCDEVKFTRYVTVKESGETSVEMETTSGQYGFIKISNPYKDGQFEHVETLSVDGKDVEVLSLDGTFGVSDGIFIKSLPSEKSEDLHEITHEEGGRIHKVSAITADYKWVKITVDEWTGWVPARHLDAGRGGPTIYTPIKIIEWELEGCYMI